MSVLTFQLLLVFLVSPFVQAVQEPRSETGQSTSRQIERIAREDRSLELVDLQRSTRRPLQVSEEAQGHVLIFLTQDCPIANQYAPKLVRLQQTYLPKGFRFFLVQVDPMLSRDDAIGHAQEYGLVDFAIVPDPKHRLVDAVGATTTPEAAVILPDGTLAYRGRIDNWYEQLGRKRSQVTRQDLTTALVQILSGQSITTPRTQAVGCLIADLKPSDASANPKD